MDVCHKPFPSASLVPKSLDLISVKDSIVIFTDTASIAKDRNLVVVLLWLKRTTLGAHFEIWASSFKEAEGGAILSASKEARIKEVSEVYILSDGHGHGHGLEQDWLRFWLMDLGFLPFWTR